MHTMTREEATKNTQSHHVYDQTDTGLPSAAKRGSREEYGRGEGWWVVYPLLCVGPTNQQQCQGLTPSQPTWTAMRQRLRWATSLIHPPQGRAPWQTGREPS